MDLIKLVSNLNLSSNQGFVSFSTTTNATTSTTTIYYYNPAPRTAANVAITFNPLPKSRLASSWLPHYISLNPRYNHYCWWLDGGRDGCSADMW